MSLSASRRARMLLTIQAATLAALSAGTLPARAQQGAAAPETAAPAATHTKSGDSYSLGVSMGERLHDAGVTPQDVSSERLAAGVRDALAGKVKMGATDQRNIDALVERARAPAAEANHRAAAAFLAENGKKAGVITTASGLQYKVLAPGSGAAPKLTDLVVVNYRGSLLDGTEFDNSAKHGGPATFQVGRIIPGWKEALQLMKPGAKYELFIPPQLAYDLRSPPEIPPGSMLLFDVELLSVKSPQPAAAAPGAAPQPNQ
jgi:FKBP-type peptidyl-prolyl cis-trans isomerase FklB